MQTAPTTPQHIHTKTGKKPPPLWFVTNGDVTIGPVTTNLLVRGVLHDRVPEGCLVRERAWSSFRQLERIREIAALRHAQSSGNVFIEKASWKTIGASGMSRVPLAVFEATLLRARDPGEVLVTCLFETMRASGAWVGAIHRRPRGRVEFVTTCVSGPGMIHRLGHALGTNDPMLELAARGSTLAETPRGSAISGDVRDRLGALPACSGVAMVPILCSGRLYAVIELGRPDHAFRDADVQGLRAVATLAADRLGMVRNNPTSGVIWGGAAANLLTLPS